jgi:hypothetical protein
MKTELHDARPNITVICLFIIIFTVVDFATAAEYATALLAAQTATSLRLTLGVLGYIESPT